MAAKLRQHCYTFMEHWLTSSEVKRFHTFGNVTVRLVDDPVQNTRVDGRRTFDPEAGFTRKHSNWPFQTS